MQQQQQRYLTEGYSEVILLTPDIAQQWLADQEPNRPLSLNTVNNYAVEMRRGAWVLNGETIKFDENLKMIDGQHRCAAVVKSGVSIRTAVIYGINRAEAFPTIDTGRIRGGSDAMTLAGEVQATYKAAFAKMLFTYDLNLWHMQRYSNAYIPTGGKPQKITNKMLIDKWDEHPKARLSFPWIQRTRNLFRTKTLAGLTHYAIMRASDQALADRFFESLQTGVDLSADDPRYAVREWLMRRYTQRDSAYVHNELAYAVFKAFNAWVAGDRMRQVKFPHRALTTADFVIRAPTTFHVGAPRLPTVTLEPTRLTY